MQTTLWQQLDSAARQQLLQRPALADAGPIAETVRQILEQVKNEGDQALFTLTERLDKVTLQTLPVSPAAIAAAEQRLDDTFKQAIAHAADNIRTFHQAQLRTEIRVETQPGITCRQVTRPIPSVGLYIPAGSAPLFSTILMLAIPAALAGCPQVILCSPPPIADEVLYTAKMCGVDAIYQVGGAQAIAAMAFGTETIPRVAKIFGPGNAWVTEAKRQVSQSIAGAAIDMPAGPSEVLVIADDQANAQFIAADLLSQAEHGPDSQVVLVTPSQSLADAVAAEIEQQLLALPRTEIARQALAASRLIVTESLQECIAISNQYAPEHLIIQTRAPEEVAEQINNAGSVFLGPWTPESVGDYASGTNHVLPTYGYAVTCSSLGVADFQKRMTIQQLSAQGLLALAPTVECLAAAEQLQAHKQAVTLRVAALKEKQ
ncbi:MAG: histidinol dehydrogenase [Enterobacteriaceae bacterium]